MSVQIVFRLPTMDCPYTLLRNLPDVLWRVSVPVEKRVRLAGDLSPIVSFEDARAPVSVRARIRRFFLIPAGRADAWEKVMRHLERQVGIKSWTDSVYLVRKLGTKRTVALARCDSGADSTLVLPNVLPRVQGNPLRVFASRVHRQSHEIRLDGSVIVVWRAKTTSVSDQVKQLACWASQYDPYQEPVESLSDLGER